MKNSATAVFQGQNRGAYLDPARKPFPGKRVPLVKLEARLGAACPVLDLENDECRTHTPRASAPPATGSPGPATPAPESNPFQGTSRNKRNVAEELWVPLEGPPVKPWVQRYLLPLIAA
ncbi:hypothetical protein NDU88_003893 [Pleurodeles waltl]|uniref:Uncharacterized protein n=1 Tax=Pleurodeles waltl TaxID=8319 RepID=A0AAV7TQ97_PLEWA|nr:hypothetical protein NDU88_003893 [Pleurodeles waltl]